MSQELWQGGLIDTDNAIIVDVEASRSIRQAEAGATRTMIDRAKDRFGLQPERLAADTACGSAGMSAWLNERDITRHIPVFDRTERPGGTFQNTVFSFSPEADEHTCPGGNKPRKY